MKLTVGNTVEETQMAFLLGVYKKSIVVPPPTDVMMARSLYPDFEGVVDQTSRKITHIPSQFLASIDSNGMAFQSYVYRLEDLLSVDQNIVLHLRRMSTLNDVVNAVLRYFLLSSDETLLFPLSLNDYFEKRHTDPELTLEMYMDLCLAEDMSVTAVEACRFRSWAKEKFGFRAAVKVDVSNDRLEGFTEELAIVFDEWVIVSPHESSKAILPDDFHVELFCPMLKLPIDTLRQFPLYSQIQHSVLTEDQVMLGFSSDLLSDRINIALAIQISEFPLRWSMIKTLFENGDDRQKRLVLFLIASAKLQFDVQYLLDQFESVSPTLQGDICQVLGYHSDQSALPVLLSGLMSDDVSMVSACCDALLHVLDDKMINNLFNIMSAPITDWDAQNERLSYVLSQSNWEAVGVLRMLWQKWLDLPHGTLISSRFSACLEGFSDDVQHPNPIMKG